MKLIKWKYFIIHLQTPHTLEWFAHNCGNQGLFKTHVYLLARVSTRPAFPYTLGYIERD